MNATVPDNIDLNNDEFQNVWNLIKNTHRSVFMTGKAGTGKSTFLRYICANTKKTHVVLAPTGIAAVNVGGQTLHSFFKIPFKPLLPDDPEFSPRRIRKTLRYSAEKIKLIRTLDLISIDEISMVRADVIDFIDKVLRIYANNMREPFGGKQLLFVGDVFQLEPVVTRDMREILRRYYKQFFFFNAHVFSSLGLVPIELRKIYRQTDNHFVSLLDRVRISHATAADLYQLNTRYVADYAEEEGYVMTLATRRDTVDAINEEHMSALTTPEYTFEGEVTGTYPDNDLPTAKVLTLKKGAQVIFIRNDMDGRWVNGSIGIVSEVNESCIRVALEDGELHELEPEMWENIQYYYDEKEKKVMETLLGTFKQYPIKPAWALTVHKSQGLTFNKVVIDFAGGAFTSGQTYVALSRCTSLEGITLLKPLSQRDIIVSTAVTDFSREFNNLAAINGALQQEKAAQLYRKALHALDHNEFAMSIGYFAQAMSIHNVTDNKAAQRLLSMKLQRFNRMQAKIDALEEVIDAQNKLLKTLEEPVSDAVMILLSDRAEGLLPTVLSRCVRFYLDDDQSEASEADTAGRFVYSILTKAPYYKKRDALSDIIADKDSSRQRAEAFLDSTEELLLKVIKERRFSGRAVSDATWETLIPAAEEVRNCRRNIRQLHSVAYSLKQLCLRV